MAMVSMADLLRPAHASGYAVGSFTVWNVEFARTVIEEAASLSAPVILMVGPVECDYAGLERLAKVLLPLIAEPPTPVALHFDHADDFETLVRAVRSGFSSVMIDASRLPFAENVAITRQVTAMAHAVGVTVEAELGRIGGQDETIEQAEAEAMLTDPAQAVDFVAQTGIDALAVSIGTVHGFYKAEPQIRLDRLQEIRACVGIPLVMHGGSGTPEEAVRKSTRHGIAKVNINTELKWAFAQGLRQILQSCPTEDDPRVYYGQAMQSARQLVRHKIELFGSAGRA